MRSKSPSSTISGNFQLLYQHQYLFVFTKSHQNINSTGELIRPLPQNLLSCA